MYFMNRPQSVEKTHHLLHGFYFAKNKLQYRYENRNQRVVREKTK